MEKKPISENYEKIIISEEDMELFLITLANPPEPNEAMRQVMKSYAKSLIARYENPDGSVLSG
jgi:uncharacterized protein (DUF1778 family)